MMKRICVVCEGQTEETFVRDVLAPHFSTLGLNMAAQTIETSLGHKGGALNYERVKRHLRNTLRQHSSPYVTTFFDLYRLDKRFPGFEVAKGPMLLSAKVAALNTKLAEDIVAVAQCEPKRFIPHIQPYEFEALLFSDIATFVSVEKGWRAAETMLSAIRHKAQSPEHINEHPDTKPAAHLERLLKGPRFSKVDHGPIAARKIGLSKLEAECLHFAAWLQKLRSIADH